MGYYSVLNLEKEPFSTSPDPIFFYRSASHNAALQRLEIAIRLRRGLNLVLGDVGIGKTTLLRTLLQNISDEKDFILHMILDPTYQSEFQFLHSLCRSFGITPFFKSTIDCKEAIEKYLYQNCVEENKTIVLLIDEGQKLNAPNLEVLRTLLNYETNEYKLLQLVIMAQLELLPKIRKIKNFVDRINLKYIINPLDKNETKEMIDFRLRQAGLNGGGSLFSEDAIELIYEHTKGYPRQVSMLCHNALESIVMKDRPIVTASIIEELIACEVS